MPVHGQAYVLWRSENASNPTSACLFHDPVDDPSSRSAAHCTRRGTVLTGVITQSENKQPLVRRARRHRRVETRSARRRRWRVSIRERAARPVSRRRARRGLQHPPHRGHGRDDASDTEPCHRFRSAFRGGAIGEPDGPPAIRVVSADDGAVGTGADEDTWKRRLAPRCRRRPASRCASSARDRRARSSAGSTAIACRCSRTDSAWATCRVSRAITRCRPTLRPHARSKWSAVRPRCSTAPMRLADS